MCVQGYSTSPGQGTTPFDFSAPEITSPLNRLFHPQNEEPEQIALPQEQPPADPVQNSDEFDNWEPKFDKKDELFQSPKTQKAREQIDHDWPDDLDSSSALVKEQKFKTQKYDVNACNHRTRYVPFVIGILGTLGFSIASHYQLVNGKKDWVISLFQLANGISIAAVLHSIIPEEEIVPRTGATSYIITALFHSLFPKGQIGIGENKELLAVTKQTSTDTKIIKVRAEFYKAISTFSYPLLFLVTEIFSHWIGDPKRDLARTAFTAFLGFHVGKDALYHISLKFPDHPPSARENAHTPRMLGFKTSDSSTARKTIWAFYLGTIILGEIIYWLVLKEKFKFDLQKLDIINDIVALVSGSYVGEFLAILIDKWKESYEIKWHEKFRASFSDDENLSDMPSFLKVFHVSDRIFAVLSSPLIGALIAFPGSDGSISNHVVSGVIGGLYGSRQYLSRREFEARYEKRWIKKIDKQDMEKNVDSKQKHAAKKICGMEHIIPTLFLVGLTVYILASVITKEPKKRDWGGAGTTIGSSIIGFAATEALARGFDWGKTFDFSNKSLGSFLTRGLNECGFRFLYSALNFTIVYQYLSQIVDIYNEENPGNRSELIYWIRIVALCSWGLAMGNNLAILAHKKWSSTKTHPLTTQELGNIAVQTLFHTN